MLPRKILIKNIRWVWIVLLLLSPLAYLAGASLLFKYDPNIKAGFSIGRESAVESAAKFARSKGVDVTGWDDLCRVRTDNNLRFYYELGKGRESDLARQLAPEVVVGIRFRSPDRSENIEVELSPDGRPLGYKRNFSRQRELGSIDEAAARKSAEESVKSRLAQHGFNANVDLKLSESSDGGVLNRDYTWKWPLQTIPELTLSNKFSFRGGLLIGDKVEAEVDSNFARSNLHSKSTLRIVSGIAYALLIGIVLIFAIYRFVQRVKQKEISYSRIALVTGIFAAAMATFILLTDVAIYQTSESPDLPVPDWVITLTASMSYVVIGIFMGLAYGSGEGDIRESYPGKLTSLDALITGRVFSRNVGRAVLLGCALGGWVFLLGGLVLLPWQGKPGYGEEFGPLDPWFGYMPWLSPLIVAWPMDTIMITIIGLLIPLPFLNRRFKSQIVVIGASTIFVWIACAGPYLGFRPWTGILLMAAARALFFLLAFFYFDLLTAIVCIAAPSSLGFALQMIGQPSAEISNSGSLALMITAASLLAAFIFSFKGRLYREDEVRPVYARYLAERLSMQAEVSAAREAQKRLMPEHLPSTPAFSIAACCHPAHEVGGDFYDIFQLEPDRLGILVAEGGGKGLGSALSIAFAKGFLMPKILGRNQTDDSPTEIVRSLQDRLATMLEEEAGVGLAYAVIDASDGTLRYSRVGAHPSIMVAGAKSADELILPEEREIKFKSNRRPQPDISVVEGSFTLGPGDSVVLFTDGIAQDWIKNKTSPEAEFAKVLIGNRKDNSGDLQEALTRSINECSKRAKRQGLDDDLTAIIVKLATSDEIAIEDNNR
jgi:serine phosphatase RsbU (regulator of sigma subunit)